MVVIRNGNLIAQFNELGAELKSLKQGETEYIWGGDEKFWSSSCPVLFPICSGLVDNTYYFGGKPYQLKKHGFASDMEFAVESLSENEVTFLLTETAETLVSYPFKFELRIHYTLLSNGLTVEYRVTNKNDYDMYFSIGGHEGFDCPEGISEYDVIFPKNETLSTALLNSNGALGYNEISVLENSNILPLDYKYFEDDALIFLNMKSDSLIVKNRNNGKAVRVTFKGFPYMLFWTKPGAPYICIEPWCGICDREGAGHDIETKEGIEHILPGETFIRERLIEIL